MEKPWLNEAIVKGLRPMGAKIGHILNPDAQLHWMSEDQRKHLLEFMRQASESDIRSSARSSTAFESPEKLEEEWEATEFIQVLNYALGDEGCHPRGYHEHNVEMADALDVEVPDRIRREWEQCQPFGKAQLASEGSLLIDKLDAIIKHFDIEVSERTDQE